MNFQTLIARVQGILLKPQEEWKKIKDEPTTIVQLYTSYAVILAAIPAIAGFLGYVLMGPRIPYLGRSIIGRIFINMIFSYAIGLAAIYLEALVVNMLAPSFGSKANNINAMKLVVYSMTPVWIAGVLYIIPSYGFWIFSGLLGLYGLYILYLGLAGSLMETPKDKIASYFVVSIIVIIVIMVAVGLIVGAIIGIRAVGLV